MRIGFVFDDSLDAPDGVQQYIMTVGRELVRRGHQVVYLVGETATHPVDGIVPFSRNVAVRFNGNIMRIPLPTSREKIRQTLRHYDFDVLHVQAPYSPFMAGRVIDQAKKVSPRTRIVATYHIAPYSGLAMAGGKILGWLNASSRRKIDQIIAVSTVAADYARQAEGVSQATVIPNPVDCLAIRQRLEEEGERDPDRPFDQVHHRNHVVFLGRFVERKGAVLLLGALEYAQAHPDQVSFPDDIHVSFAGKGPLLEESKKRAAALKIPTDFLGFIDEEEKAPYLASADVAVFPSKAAESFGIVLIEAMAAGSGVILAGDNPGYHSTMLGNEEILFDVTSPDRAYKLAMLIAKALNDDVWARKIHSWQEKLITRYDVRTVVDQLEAVYRPR